MIGWLLLAVLFGLALLALRLFGMRGALLQIAAAALLLGCAGYALQGNPGLEGSPRAASAREPPIPLTRIRHALFGQFTPAETWLRISEALARRGNTKDAAGVLQTAVRERPDNALLWIGLGNALIDHAGMITPASQFAFRRAAELAPGHPAPPFFMGLALARSGDREGALSLWRELLENAPAEAEWRPMVEDLVALLEGRAPTPSQSPRS
ncbi:MAG TPA: tetratricopeptide repeat protein [Sphingomicrobium sp.]|nr:tetratricopeptide repeat protein [Sphingomicrobium sp.]